MKEKKEKPNSKVKENDEQNENDEILEKAHKNKIENLEEAKENQKVIDEKKIKEEEFFEELKIAKEEKIRLLAEMENVRKRFEREKIESIKYGSINLARDILSPADNIARALSAIPEKEEHSESITNLIDGLKIVQKEFSTILEKNGIKRVESIDKKFDPDLHQAMIEIEKDNVEEGIVVQEIQAGYTMYDRLLRPAMVGVSKKPLSKQIKEDEKKTSDENGKKG